MFRIGIGYDVHAFDSSESSHHYITLCGIKINHSKKLLAHSDGDVALHALTDAILGAIGHGSIGQHFPPTDMKWNNCSSETFLIHANNLMQSHEFQINNIDLIIICEEPKIMPYAFSMQENISKILQINLSQVNIKAVTTEGLGAIGRKEGIAVQAAVLIQNHKVTNTGA